MPRRQPPTRPRAPIPSVAGVVCLLAAASLAAGCKEGIRDPLGLTSRFAPFERLPYLQAVDTTSAVVRWLAYTDAVDSAHYRPGREGEWLPLRIERSDERPGTMNGSVTTRTARVEGLDPGSEVSYRVFADTVEAGPFVFRTAPSATSGTPVRLLAFGDSGFGTEAQLQLADLMAGEPFDLAVHMGDIAYDIGSEEDFTLRHFQVYRNLLSRVPFFPSPGNHDLRSENGAPYERAFVWDAPADGARYYAFRWGPVEFIALDTTDEDEIDWGEPLPPGAYPFPDPDPGPPTDGADLRDGVGRQYEWLVETLARTRADSTIRWTIVFMHHPPYSHAVGLSGHGSDVHIQRELGPLFDEYGVDFVLSGHDHHYERTHPLHDDEVAVPGCGPVYVLSGGGGASRYARGVGRSAVQAAASLEHHYMRIEVYDGQIRGAAVSENGVELDRFTILPYAGNGDDGRPLQRRCR